MRTLKYISYLTLASTVVPVECIWDCGALFPSYSPICILILFHLYKYELYLSTFVILYSTSTVQVLIHWFLWMTPALYSCKYLHLHTIRIWWNTTKMFVVSLQVLVEKQKYLYCTSNTWKFLRQRGENIFRSLSCLRGCFFLRWKVCTATGDASRFFNHSDIPVTECTVWLWVMGYKMDVRNEASFLTSCHLSLITPQ